MGLFKSSQTSRIDYLSPLGPLVLRLWLAQVFFFAGYGKVKQGFTAPEWFANLSFPPGLDLLPININWILAGYGEVIFAVMLLIGLAGRFAVLGLMFITWVAIYTVHFDLGFAGWNQVKTGFKIPLMLGIMQLALLFGGMGKLSLDYVIRDHVAHR